MNFKQTNNNQGNVINAMFGSTHTFEAQGNLQDIFLVMHELKAKHQRMLASISGQLLHLRCKNDDDYKEFVEAYVNVEKRLGL